MAEKKAVAPGYMTYREAAIMFSLMPDEEAAQTIKATVNYYLYGTMADLEGVAGKVFEIMRADIDRNNERSIKKSVPEMRKTGRRGADREKPSRNPLGTRWKPNYKHQT